MTTGVVNRYRRDDRRTAHDARPNTWRLKACRRCGGDLMREVDEIGQTGYFCLQCGHTQNLSVEEQTFDARLHRRARIELR